VRPQLTLMFHESQDQKVIRHCKKMGFGTVRELRSGEWLSLADDFEIRCDTWCGSDDSWLLVRTSEGTILNLNDCQANTPEQMQALHTQTGDIDVLLTQYSISAWDGNMEDTARRDAGAQAMIDRACAQTRILGAKWVLPFASFIWFCHEENAYMNSALRPVGDVARAIATETDGCPVVLYPGDRWDVGATHDPEPAIARYATDVASVGERELIASEPVSIDALQDSAQRFLKRVREGRSPLRMRLGAIRESAAQRRRVHADAPLTGAVAALGDLLTLRARPARIWLTHLNRAVTFDLERGLQPTSVAADECDLEIGSAALHYGMRFLWGGETLIINGRFREVYRDGRLPLFRHLGLTTTMNREEGAAPKPI
jgi:hypothetical protein